ncbi:hypothetical protein BS50DRAFT_137070 [Corynespora cassiicola Philippines]|uniref:Uncharacterized protein n=1 Tax=Corynespora cassiicola Philippines TaxID=1448308 RepID=A0A2T2N9I6_CORCC|nr:hypothetical protein BS50DRAFT_137070 [Corynespora cassiicola Philippines]
MQMSDQMPAPTFAGCSTAADEDSQLCLRRLPLLCHEPPPAPLPCNSSFYPPRPCSGLTHLKSAQQGGLRLENPTVWLRSATFIMHPALASPHFPVSQWPRPLQQKINPQPFCFFAPSVDPRTPSDCCLHAIQNAGQWRPVRGESRSRGPIPTQSISSRLPSRALWDSLGNGLVLVVRAALFPIHCP